MKAFRKILVFGGIFSLGFLLGPVLFAALASINAPTGKAAHLETAYRVLSAFDDHDPQPFPMVSLNLGIVVRECGYDEKRLFASDDEIAQRQRWTPRTGYFDLTIWLGDEFRRETEKRRAEQLGRHLSSYELAFLDKCLRQTAFASICGGKVRNILKDGDLLSQHSLPYNQPDVDQSRRTQTICTYLDGIAARSGQALAQRTKSGGR